MWDRVVLLCAPQRAASSAEVGASDGVGPAVDVQTGRADRNAAVDRSCRCRPQMEAEGITLALTFWESREVADRHRPARMRFRDRVTAAVNVQVEETVDYEVTFAHLGPRMAAPKE